VKALQCPLLTQGGHERPKIVAVQSYRAKGSHQLKTLLAGLARKDRRDTYGCVCASSSDTVDVEYQ
jgi:hypothetical protein